MNRNLVLNADTFNYGQYYIDDTNDDDYDSSSGAGVPESNSGGSSRYRSSNHRALSLAAINDSTNNDGGGVAQQQRIPTEEMILKQLTYRNTALNETAFHRCVHPHDGISDTCRNVVYILHDRQLYGSRAVTLNQKRLPLPRIPQNDRRGRIGRSRTLTEGNGTNNSSRTTSPIRCKEGERSPNTGFDSPVSTTQIPEEGGRITQHQEDDNDDDGNLVGDQQERRRGEGALLSSHIRTRVTKFDIEGRIGTETLEARARVYTSYDQQLHQDNTSAATSKRGRMTYPLRIMNEVRMFGEYSLATKYHSSFLNHLGGNDKLDENGNRPISSSAISTISVAFSVDGKTMASTHGDHTVKVSCCETGRLLQSLDGHPRTPWTVKYHPINSHVVASGCLGHQVRVWNWVTKTCLQMVRLEFAIISLSFHPSGTVLAIANGTRLHFWGVDDDEDEASKLNRKKVSRTEIASPSSVVSVTGSSVSPHSGSMNISSRYSNSSVATSRGRLNAQQQRAHFFGTSIALPPPVTNSVTSNNNFHSQNVAMNQQNLHSRSNFSTQGIGPTTAPNMNRSSALTELDQKHMLRCVHFPPGGTTLIIGGVNPPTEHHHPHDPRHRGGRGGGPGPTGMSFYLRLWDFDLEKALEIPPANNSHNQHHATNNSGNTTMIGVNAPFSAHHNFVAYQNRHHQYPTSSVPSSILSSSSSSVSSGIPYNLNNIAMTMTRRAISNVRICIRVKTVFR